MGVRISEAPVFWFTRVQTGMYEELYFAEHVSGRLGICICKLQLNHYKLQTHYEHLL